MPYSRPPLERGVYRSPFLTRSGHRELVAVDSDGREVCRAIVFDGEVEKDVTKILKRILHHYDGIGEFPLPDEAREIVTIEARNPRNAINKLIALVNQPNEEES